MDWPIQGHAALIVTSLSVAITLCLLWFGLKAEKNRPADETDDH
jgi:hypothetical protein